MADKKLRSVDTRQLIMSSFNSYQNAAQSKVFMYFDNYYLKLLQHATFTLPVTSGVGFIDTSPSKQPIHEQLLIYSLKLTRT